MAAKKSRMGSHPVERDAILKGLRSGQDLAPIYLIYGDEPFLIRHLLGQIEAHACPEGLLTDGRHESFGGRTTQIDFAALKTELQTPSWVNPRRLVVLHDTGLFQKKTGHEEFLDLIQGIPPGATLILDEKKVDGRYRKLYTAIEEAGGVICHIDRQDERMLVGWIASYFKNYGLPITQRACESLILRCDGDMTLLMQEMQKLRLYAQAEGLEAIRLDELEVIAIPDLQGSIFNLGDCIVQRDLRGAMTIYESLLEKREPLPLLLLMLGRLFRQLLVAQASGFQVGRLSTMLGENRRFILNRLVRQARQYRPEQLKALVIRAADCDAQMKGGSQLDPELLLELLILTAMQY